MLLRLEGQTVRFSTTQKHWFSDHHIFCIFLWISHSLKMSIRNCEAGVDRIRDRFELTVPHPEGVTSSPTPKRTCSKSNKKSKSFCSNFCSKFEHFLIHSRFAGIPFAFLYGGYLYYLITYLILSDAGSLPLNKSLNTSESVSRWIFFNQWPSKSIMKCYD